MKTKQRSLLALSTSIAALLLGGCAGFKGHNLPKANNLSPKSQTEAKTKCYTECKVATVKTSFDEALLSSNRFTLVESPKEADVVVRLTSYNERPVGIPPFLSGLTFMILPCWFTDVTHVGAEVRRGSLSQTYNIKDSSTIMIWPPLILAAPFAPPLKVAREVSENVYQTLVSKIEQDGFLK